MDHNAAKCAHAPCKCSVSEGERFCSKHCEEHAAKQDPEGNVMCGCGHPECGGTEAGA
jgi:hypothetical protein